MHAAVMPLPRRQRLQLFAYNLGNFMRTLAVSKTGQLRSLTNFREKDRRQGRQPRPLRDAPDGRGRSAGETRMLIARLQAALALA
jgi:hypothetical protein